MKPQRFEDSPELFGVGMGTSTTGEISCDWCGAVHPENEHQSTSNTTFGGKQICECCFETIETAVLQRITEIIPWYIRLLKSKKSQVKDRERQLRELKVALAKK